MDITQQVCKCIYQNISVAEILVKENKSMSYMEGLFGLSNFDEASENDMLDMDIYDESCCDDMFSFSDYDDIYESAWDDDYGEEFTESTRYKREIPKMLDRYWTLVHESIKYFDVWWNRLENKIAEFKKNDPKMYSYDARVKAKDDKIYQYAKNKWDLMTQESKGIERALEALGISKFEYDPGMKSTQEELKDYYHRWKECSDRFKKLQKAAVEKYKERVRHAGILNRKSIKAESELDLKEELDRLKHSIQNERNEYKAISRNILRELKEYTNNLKKAISEYQPDGGKAMSESVFDFGFDGNDDIYESAWDEDIFTEDRAWKNKMMDYEKEYKKNNEKVSKLEDMKRSTTSDRVKDALDKKIEALRSANKKLRKDYDKMAVKGDVRTSDGGEIDDVSYGYVTRGVDSSKGKRGNVYSTHSGKFTDDGAKKEPGYYKKLQDVLKECTETEACDFIESAVFDGYLEEIALESVEIPDKCPSCNFEIDFDPSTKENDSIAVPGGDKEKPSVSFKDVTISVPGSNGEKPSAKAANGGETGVPSGTKVMLDSDTYNDALNKLQQSFKEAFDVVGALKSSVTED